MSAKNIHIAPVSSKHANALVKRVHYSGKVVANSQLHFGVFYQEILEGVMSFGPSLDKRKIQGLVVGTSWNGFLELNRMAFSDTLPRNSESRALGVAFRIIKKNYPHIEWIISFADGTQCGDGTIYRAAGFCLTGIKKNDQIWIAPEGSTFSRMSLTDNSSHQQQQQAEKICRTTMTKGKHIMHAMSGRCGGKAAAAAANGVNNGAASMKNYYAAGFRPLAGFQLRYIYFLNPDAKERLTVPILPFSAIEERGAGMYKGIKRGKQAIAPDQGDRGGAAPTATLQDQAQEAGDGRDHLPGGGAAPTPALQDKL